ncbi:MAG TPA: hypothetical protein VMR20_00790, partial [Verrucomicrobiae bacterium]|nr:hypothetical protein [Verrucomicrobiae bacterium]
VRAFGEQGRDDPCYITVCPDRGAGGLSRPFRTNVFHTDTLKMIIQGAGLKPARISHDEKVKDRFETGPYKVTDAEEKETP